MVAPEGLPWLQTARKGSQSIASSKVRKDYPDYFKNLTIQTNVNETLEEMGPPYYKAFSDRYKS